MGKRNLKEQNKDFEINIVDLISKFDPSETSKYTKFLVKILKNELDEMKKTPKLKTIEIAGNTIFKRPTGANVFEDVLIRYLSEIYGMENMETLISFHRHTQENRITGRDIDTYKYWDEVRKEVSLADLKKIKKSHQKEVQKIFENEEWLIIKPLTFDSSLVYGSGTKWCTTSRNNKEYFYRYSMNGVLCYAISKLDGDKFGIFYDVNISEFSIWDVNDRRIDSVESTIPADLMVKIYKLMKVEKINYEFFSKSEKEKYQAVLEQPMQPMPEPIPQEFDDLFTENMP